MARRGNGEGSIGRVKGRDLFVARYHVDLPDGTRKRKALYGKDRAARGSLRIGEQAETMSDYAPPVKHLST